MILFRPLIFTGVGSTLLRCKSHGPGQRCFSKHTLKSRFLFAMDGLSESLLERAIGRGSIWLTDLAEKSQLVGELRPLRRLAWIKLLGLVNSDSLDTWVEQLQMHRTRYRQLEDDYRRETDVKAADPKLCNPLSRNADNPYLKIQVNEELLKEIWKDVERTFPECEFLSSAESRKASYGDSGWLKRAFQGGCPPKPVNSVG
eukprot:symbB.v1.2.010098.t1/scaffold653.1/size176079/8